MAGISSRLRTVATIRMSGRLAKSYRRASNVGKPVARQHEMQDLVGEPEAKESDDDLDEDPLQNVLVDVVTEFVREDGFDLVVAVVRPAACRRRMMRRVAPMPISAALAFFDFSDRFHS